MKIGNLITGNAEFSFDYFKVYGFNGFCCSKCDAKMFLNLDEYNAGQPIHLLETIGKDIISILVKSNIVNERKLEIPNDNFTQYKILNLEALYLNKICKNCNANYLVIFGMGDTQPGREQVVLKGIWELI